jgi:Winged helix-turn-helix domain (DUF2582)
MVRDISLEFGEDAGKIWNTLFQNGPLCKDDLISFARLNDEAFQAGLGWLARENKISLVDDVFKLDVTNLTKEIGPQAGRLWRILDIWGMADFVSLRRLSDLSDSEVYRALGWLAREGKILVDDEGKFCLK